MLKKLDAADNDTVEFPVVAVFGEEGTKVGTPYVDGAVVTGKGGKERQGQEDHSFHL